MTKQQREELRHLKAEISAPKSVLIRILNRVETLSPRQAQQLGNIIMRLEEWQTK